MEVSLRQLRKRPSDVVDAVRAGERVTLKVHREPVADIVPYRTRTGWLLGTPLGHELAERAADPGLRAELDALAGQMLGEC